MMRILKLRRLSNDNYRIFVHLDTDKLDEQGAPDETYVLRVMWPPKPTGMTHAEYLTQERPPIRAICVRTLAEIAATEGQPLSGEGDEL